MQNRFARANLHVLYERAADIRIIADRNAIRLRHKMKVLQICDLLHNQNVEVYFLRKNKMGLRLWIPLGSQELDSTVPSVRLNLNVEIDFSGSYSISIFQFLLLFLNLNIQTA